MSIEDCCRPIHVRHSRWHDGRFTVGFESSSWPSSHRGHRAWPSASSVALGSRRRSVAAQSWPERVHVSVNGAFQATTNDFSDRFEFERDLETGSTAVDYPVQGGFIFDAGAGYRFWKNLAAGVSVSYFTRDDVASTTSSFPHPFFFNQPRDGHGRSHRREAVGNGGARPGDVPGEPRRPAAARAVGRPVVLLRAAGPRDRGHRHRDLSVRHGGVRLGQDDAGERLGGRPSTSARTSCGC